MENLASAESIFFAALVKGSPQERSAYLDEACGGDEDLRRHVERLLKAQPKVGDFLQCPAPGLVATIDELSVNERPGLAIGPYKLLEQIGEGGFGIVFMAEQQEPIRRKVALKVVKPGMDTRQVIARFKAERQALALMDHPNIAKVLDAGQTGSGRPYFVMDLVKGVPITEFCHQGQLAPKERLELFVHVCQAVQHAHQKGIIHRDIKPSNVLVTLHDGTPLVKVIDFGIAKALGQQLTDKTLFTGFAQMIGTPLYMSPEQAALSNVDVDTRSDIYSLGVLLYELLTGTTPFDKDRFKEAGYDEIRRIIREEEPPRPSTRMSTLGQAAETFSTQRKNDPKRLSRIFRGELDWMVMKALEKDRNRRYETASAFAADVQRYLADEPVLACPPSSAYRLRKFVRRNKRTLTVTVFLFLLVGTLAATLGWTAHDRALRQAQTERQRDLAEASIGNALAQAESSRHELHQILRTKGGVFGLLNQPDRWQAHLQGAQAALDRANALLAGAGEGIDQALEHKGLALETVLKADAGDRQLALALEKIREDQATIVEGRLNVTGADAAYQKTFAAAGFDVLEGDPRAVADRIARSLIKEQLVAALDDWRPARTRFPEQKPVARLLHVARLAAPDPAWGDQLRRVATWNNKAAVEQLARKAAIGDLSPQMLHLMAILLSDTKSEERLGWLRRAQAQVPTDFWLNFELANALADSNLLESSGFCRAALAVRPNSAAIYNNLGKTLFELKRFDEAVAACRKAVQLGESAMAYNNLGNALGGQKRLHEAIAAYRKAILIDPNSWRTTTSATTCWS